jgi:Uma2 family endonuclease
VTAVPKPATDQTTTLPYRLALNIRALEMTEEQFLQLCSDNGDIRMELTANRELIIMPPNGLESGWQEGEVCLQVANWAKRDGTGRAFGPNAGYTLPNGAVRAPDASWMPLSRWESLSRDDQTKFGHTFPDFAIELRSPSDSLSDVQDKMTEYLENGVILGFLLDLRQRRVYVYRPGQDVEVLEEPETVSGDPALPGFVLDLGVIW